MTGDFMTVVLVFRGGTQSELPLTWGSSGGHQQFSGSSETAGKAVGLF